MLDFTGNQSNSSGSMPPPGGNGNNNGGNGFFSGIPGAVSPAQAAQDASGVLDILVDYNKKCANSTPAKFRDKEIFTVISQLIMHQKTCSLLIGAPGTGKTKLVEEIARLIATNSPYTSALNDYTVYELPLASLMAGTSYRGQLEEKLQNIIEYCENNKVILFIDEIHQLCENRIGGEGVSQALKPAMARGAIKIIGATTIQESKSLLDDPAFNRRFNKVNVCELTVNQTESIIEDVYMPKMASHYGIGFGKNVAHCIVQAAERRKGLTGHEPDVAITMLDKVCAYVQTQRNLNIATCTDEALRDTMKATPLVINVKNIEDYNKTDSYVLPDNFNAVKEKIYYRDSTIEKLYNTLKDFIKINAIFPDEKPFVVDIEGDACSGKTTFARESAKLIDDAPVYIDLSDYIDSHSLTRIIGAAVGLVGSDSKKEMPFDIVESNPQKIVILDNFDKAHPVVQEFFKSAIDTGLIKYADNRTVDISKCIIFRIKSRSKQTGSIGFTEKVKKDSATSIVLDKLTDDELMTGAKMLVEDMIKDLKTKHTRYGNLPDTIELSDEDKSKIVNARDMHFIAKQIILAKI